MKSDAAERQLREFYQARRQQETAAAPAFAALAAAAVPSCGHGHAWRPWAALGAAAAILLALGGGLWLASGRRDLPRPDLPQLTALSAWSAPTDVLLAIPTPLWGSQVETVTDALGGAGADASLTTTTTTKETP